MALVNKNISFIVPNDTVVENKKELIENFKVIEQTGTELYYILEKLLDEAQGKKS